MAGVLRYWIDGNLSLFCLIGGFGWELIPWRFGSSGCVVAEGLDCLQNIGSLMEMKDII